MKRIESICVALLTMKYLISISLFIASLHLVAIAQTTQPQNIIHEDVPMNKRDTRGLAHGLWYKKIADRMGEPAYFEFGNYLHGLRTGLWTKLDEEGHLISQIQYRDNVPNGEVKYFDKGRLLLTGEYRGVNPRQLHDTIVVVDPVSLDWSFVRIKNDAGFTKHGTWRHYDIETGRLIKEETYYLDEIVNTKTFGLSPADSVYYLKHQSKLPHNKKQPKKTEKTSLTGF
jgi:hypothetical protein